MMIKYLLIFLLLIAGVASAQAPNIIYGKDVIISTRDASSAELTILNNSRNVLGFFKNIGGGKGQYRLLTQADVAGLSDSLLIRYTKAQADARFKAIAWVPSWDDVTSKPTNFPTTYALSNDIIDSFATKISIRDTGNLKARFSNDVTLNGPAGIRVGKYTNGQTIPAAGKTLDQFLTDIAIEAVPPTYVAPTAGISSSPGGGSYERGTNLGTITLSGSFTQNNGGTSTGNTFAKYISSWNNLGSNTDAITSLTVPVYYRVTTSYNQGACLNNNLGQQDCTGRINAGSVTSGNIAFIPFDKRYWGFVSSTSPSNSTILALTQDNNGSTAALNLSNIAPTGSQYLAYFTLGSVSHVIVNGFDVSGSYVFTTRSITNAQGNVQTYTYVYSNNAQTSTLSTVSIY